jgi:hypothetical protein
MTIVSATSLGERPVLRYLSIRLHWIASAKLVLAVPRSIIALINKIPSLIVVLLRRSSGSDSSAPTAAASIPTHPSVGKLRAGQQRATFVR